MKCIDELDLKGKRVLVRADMDAPLDENGNITGDTGIRAALPSIEYALQDSACVIVASHMWQPKG